MGLVSISAYIKVGDGVILRLPLAAKTLIIARWQHQEQTELFVTMPKNKNTNKP